MLKKKNLNPEKEAELQKEPKEKGDVPAMLLAAFLNLFLPAVIALLIFAGLFCGFNDRITREVTWMHKCTLYPKEMRDL